MQHFPGGVVGIGRYDRSALSYAQQLKEEQLDRDEKGAERGKGTECEKAAESQSAAKSLKETQKAQNDAKAPKGMPAPRDEHISGEKAYEGPSGLYRLGQGGDAKGISESLLR